jgi:hypothetical protein
VVSGVIDKPTADHKIGNFKLDYLAEYESIFKKVLNCAHMKLFDEKN